MTYQISDDQVALRSRTSANATLDAFMDLRLVDPGVWVESQQVAIGAVQHVLVDSTFLSGNLSVGTATATDGYIVAELAGAVGTAATTAVTNNGDVLNLVPIRDATTHQSIAVSNERVWGLLQCSNGVADGTAIAGPGSENVQLSFVTIASNGSLTLSTQVAGTIEFAPPTVTRFRNLTDFWTVGQPMPRPVLGSGATVTARTLTVTTAYTAAETITISTGAGGTAGVSTVSTNENDTITLPASAALFNADHGIQIYLNGLKLTKGVDVTWISTDSIQIAKALYVNEELTFIYTV